MMEFLLKGVIPSDDDSSCKICSLKIDHYVSRWGLSDTWGVSPCLFVTR